MIHGDMTYCNGKGCLLRHACRRYLEGQRIMLNREGDTNQYWWVDCCDPETRELYDDVFPICRPFDVEL